MMNCCESYSNKNEIVRIKLQSKTILFIGMLLSFVQSLDIESATCRCTTKSKFGIPFVVLWNSPTEGCHVNFSVNIELEKYGILTNSNQTWDGEVVTVFYNGQLGLYPYYYKDDKTSKFNAGLPQLVNMTEHLKKATQHIVDKIPEPNYSGLAVIDWEGWRPVWETNFGKKHLYIVESIALVKKDERLRNSSIIHAEAKRRFEGAGRRLMVETIKLGQKLRPRALWGFYGYPECHGNCTEQVMGIYRSFNGVTRSFISSPFYTLYYISIHLNCITIHSKDFPYAAEFAFHRIRFPITYLLLKSAQLILRHFSCNKIQL